MRALRARVPYDDECLCDIMCVRSELTEYVYIAVRYIYFILLNTVYTYCYFDLCFMSYLSGRTATVYSVYSPITSKHNFANYSKNFLIRPPKFGIRRSYSMIRKKSSLTTNKLVTFTFNSTVIFYVRLSQSTNNLKKKLFCIF